jgi:hypothetical protein
MSLSLPSVVRHILVTSWEIEEPRYPGYESDMFLRNVTDKSRYILQKHYPNVSKILYGRPPSMLLSIWIFSSTQ